MIVVIDYGMGNIGSILNMLKKIDVEAIGSASVSDIENAEKLILPGVGAFNAGMKNLRDLRLVPLLEQRVFKEKVPILGTCLGMQLLTKASEEGSLPGLGWIDGETVRFHFDEGTNLKIPHMGWNTTDVKRESPLVRNLPTESRFYFVHSFHLKLKNKEDVVATTNYGYDFPSIIRKDNIFGVQFHPEKSHKFGMQLLKNFVEL